MTAMEAAAKRRFGDIVVERGLIDQRQLDEALAVQREVGGKIGEILVDMGFITRLALAGVISEQWDDLRVTAHARKLVEPQAAPPSAVGATVVEIALRERLEQMAGELVARDQLIAEQGATIAALLAERTDHAA
ncbi:MAG: hypothetical protein ACJ76I_13460 [Gaiellaceae bacterium]